MEQARARRARRIREERWSALHELEELLDTPMVVLGFVWLGLLVLELTRGLTPLQEAVGTAIWALFVLDFGLRFWLAPAKLEFLKQNWITVLALLLPALRVFRLARAARLLRASRAARGVRLFRVFSSLNRGMKALRATLRRRGFGYAVALTGLVTLGGAAGMFTLENEATGGRAFPTFGDALWWTAMLMTTQGSEYWPQSGEGRTLCLVLSLYAFAVFGYVTATLATFFVGRDAASREGELAGAESVESLRAEVRELRAEIHTLTGELRARQ